MSDRLTPNTQDDEDDAHEWLREPMRQCRPQSPNRSPRPFGHELPRYHPDTGEAIYACPGCESFRTESRHIARRIVSAIGTAAGGAGAAAAALSGAELGAAAGTLGGPFGALCGSVAGAIIAGLAGAAAGCATGAALGEAIDQKVLDNLRCRACGHTFSIRPD